MEYDPRKVLTVGLRDYNRVVWLVLRFQPENRIESALLGLVHTIVVLIKRGKKKRKSKNTGKNLSRLAILNTNLAVYLTSAALIQVRAEGTCEFFSCFVAT